MLGFRLKIRASSYDFRELRRERTCLRLMKWCMVLLVRFRKNKRMFLRRKEIYASVDWIGAPTKQASCTSGKPKNNIRLILEFLCVFGCVMSFLTSRFWVLFSRCDFLWFWLIQFLAKLVNSNEFLMLSISCEVWRIVWHLVDYYFEVIRMFLRTFHRWTDCENGNNLACDKL